jgi:oligopeptide transport system permease protein
MASGRRPCDGARRAKGWAGLLGFIIRRILWTIPVIVVATMITFALVNALPAEPFNSPRLTETARENLLKIYGFDQPVWRQYVNYLGNLAQGDLGQSVHYRGDSVAEIIFANLPATMLLGLFAFLFALVVGTTMGALAALHVNTKIDGTLLFISTFAFALPLFVVCNYWVAYLWFDWDIPWQRSGPMIVLGLGIMPYFARLVRASMLETLQAEFVMAARSKGLPWRRTVTRHVLRNSLIPMVTNAGPLFGFVLTGSFIIETIMAVPGIAYVFVRAFSGTPDTYLILNTTVLLAVIIVVVNLMVDLLVVWLDPRISHD